jgi:hypothetical protein
VADESKDSVTCDALVGHETPHMSSVYRETISEARLKAVSDHVRAWLFQPPKMAGEQPTSGGNAQEGSGTTQTQ